MDARQELQDMLESEDTVLKSSDLTSANPQLGSMLDSDDSAIPLTSDLQANLAVTDYDRSHYTSFPVDTYAPQLAEEVEGSSNMGENRKDFAITSNETGQEAWSALSELGYPSPPSKEDSTSQESVSGANFKNKPVERAEDAVAETAEVVEQSTESVVQEKRSNQKYHSDEDYSPFSIDLHLSEDSVSDTMSALGAPTDSPTQKTEEASDKVDSNVSLDNNSEIPEAVETEGGLNLDLSEKDEVCPQSAEISSTTVMDDREKEDDVAPSVEDMSAAAADEAPQDDAIMKSDVEECEKEVTEPIEDVFVRDGVENEKEDNEKTQDATDQEAQDGMDQPQEDPIASDDFQPELDQEQSEEQTDSEELCIIPDTKCVLSQEEFEATTLMVPLKDLADNSSADNNSNMSETKYVVLKSNDTKANTCLICKSSKKAKYTTTFAGKPGFICTPKCLNSFKSKHGKKVIVREGTLTVKNLAGAVSSDTMVANLTVIRKCAECDKEFVNTDSILTWGHMDYCTDACIAKYQGRVGSICCNCDEEVSSLSMGRYCVRFGYDLKQFCKHSCLETYKRLLKMCCFCQKDLADITGSFVAPVGDKNNFKDFCSQACMDKYNHVSNNAQPTSKPGCLCFVCSLEKPITIEYELEGKEHQFCGEPCFVAFKFVNNIAPAKCDLCRKYFDQSIMEGNSVYCDEVLRHFCSKNCQNIYIVAYRRIAPCKWCQVKKYNFDLIKLRGKELGEEGVLVCSVHCLNQFRNSLAVKQSIKSKCDHCEKFKKTLYQLSMSDGSLKSFCSFDCSTKYQKSFPKTQLKGRPRKTAAGVLKRSNCEAAATESPIMPVISSVTSLAHTNGPTTPSILTSSDLSQDTATNGVQGVKIVYKTIVVIKPQPPPLQKNRATMCKPLFEETVIQEKPQMVNAEVQTDDIKVEPKIIPVPVPIYVPTPMWMYSMPVPTPVPFPLPVPIPIFVPTSRNSANGIMKEIKKIQVKIPTDPYEAELLMMAEMVAADKKEEHTDSDTDEDDNTATHTDDAAYSPEPDASNAFGEDMLQIALKMASELDEPAVDLEGALTANTITAPPVPVQHNAPVFKGELEESVDDPQPINTMIDRQVMKGKKRVNRSPRSSFAIKRNRRLPNPAEVNMMSHHEAQPTEPVEKPDANMCLKYTFGVNAWRQWVTTKNAELEKGPRRFKLFKPEILQLTADELNYSLCLFVKEVRKPNGQEYAPDTIYYLCLGIQQYLYENGRIDNIFCDPYYERFTDCLEEIARRFTLLYNDSHYIVTRVEEEHLWESKQLGAHSPHVLLSTLMFFNTKHFNLTTVEEHSQLSFSHIMKHWRRNPTQPGTSKGSRNVLLRFYPPSQSAISPEAAARRKKVYEQLENEENPLRCPVKLYEFYLSKCPESVKSRSDVFYLQPERSCVPDSPVWYSTMPLPTNALEKMLHRVKMVKEINVALLTS